MQCVRDRYPGLFLASTTQIMWQDDMVGVAHFVRDCFDLMHAPVDDDASSDASSEQPSRRLEQMSPSFIQSLVTAHCSISFTGGIVHFVSLIDP